VTPSASSLRCSDAARSVRILPRAAAGIATPNHVGPVLLIFASFAAWPTALLANDPDRVPHVVRSTVQIRNGAKRGSGTVIASVPGETLILTAAHVVHEPGKLEVELHRHNLGYNVASLTQGGGWPRLVQASVVATDAGSDVAVLRVRGMVALAYVARFDVDAPEPARGDVVTSVGIDRTLHLTRWETTSLGSALIDLKRGGGAHPFTLTSRAPEHGRSGGGLFRRDGTVVGVCTGQLHVQNGKQSGIFASAASIRDLLRAHGLEKVGRAPVKRPAERTTRQ
jgi:S1-C subfamily serine protease